MVVNRRKKAAKYRGSITHGGGHRKKRRGAGSRGGRGNAGTGKRAGHKKAGRPPSLGQRGFLPRRTAHLRNAENLFYFTSQRLEKWVKEGKVAKEKEIYVVDFLVLGISKILSTGNTQLKLKVVNGKVSEKAKEKIIAAGGEVVGAQETPEEHPAAAE